MATAANMVFGSKSVSFKPAKDIPSLAGKVILVTGANVGLGKQSVLELARHKPENIWLAARNVCKAQAAMDDIRKQVPEAPITLLELDLASFASVKRAAQRVLAESSRLDILLLNAGIMAAAPGLTEDGYELQFGTNHMGHALLTKLLLPLLTKTANTTPTADVRIVSVVSHGHVYAPKPAGILFDKVKTPGIDLGAFERYGQSKLASILWVRKLASLYPRLTVAAVHPGVVQTNLLGGADGASVLVKAIFQTARKLRLASSVETGVRNQLWAAVGAGPVRSGEYFEPVGVAGLVSELGRDDELAERLWVWMEGEFEGHVNVV